MTPPSPGTALEPYRPRPVELAGGTALELYRPRPVALAGEKQPDPPRKPSARALAAGMFVTAGAGAALAIAAVIVLFIGQPTGRALTTTALAAALGVALTGAGVMFGSAALDPARTVRRG